MKKFLPIILALILLAFPPKALAYHFYFEPQSKEVYKDDEFDVEVKLDTQDMYTTGVDIVINFNKDDLEVKGVGFNNLYALNDSQTDNNGGTLKLFSTVNSGNTSYKGNDRLVTVRFKAKKEINETKINFSCQDNETNQDSNIWRADGVDILECQRLQEGKYKIKPAQCGVPDVPSNPKAVSGPNPGQITLTWQKVGGGNYYGTSYGPASLDYKWGNNNVGDVDKYVVGNLTPGKPYYFIIFAMNSCGSSGALNEVAAYSAKNPEVVITKGQETPPSPQIQYWKEPERTEESPSPQPKVILEASPEPSQTPEKTSILPSLPSLPGWLKWIGIIGIVLLVLSILGKRFVNEEDNYNEPPPPPPPSSPSSTSYSQSNPQSTGYSKETAYAPPRSNIAPPFPPQEERASTEIYVKPGTTLEDKP